MPPIQAVTSSSPSRGCASAPGHGHGADPREVFSPGVAVASRPPRRSGKSVHCARPRTKRSIPCAVVTPPAAARSMRVGLVRRWHSPRSEEGNMHGLRSQVPAVHPHDNCARSPWPAELTSRHPHPQGPAVAHSRPKATACVSCPARIQPAIPQRVLMGRHAASTRYWWQAALGRETAQQQSALPACPHSGFVRLLA